MAKQMGSIQTVDEQGRIPLPTRLQETHGIIAGDEFEFLTQGTTIMMVRHAPKCLACREDTDVQRYNDTFLCIVCREAIHKTLAN